MQIRLTPFAALVLAALVASGCRQSEPSEFTASRQVAALTEGIDPKEEKEDFDLMVELQQDVAKVLAERCGTSDVIKVLGNPHVDQDQLKRGYVLYADYCTQCHGVNGDGNGPLAAHLNPRPRNYTAGVFKFVATDNGVPPRKADIVATLRRGVTGTSMPSFKDFSQEDLEAVAEYVFALTFRGLLESRLAQIAYDDEELPDDEGIDEVVAELLEPWVGASEQVVMPLSPMPRMSAETIAHGKELFVKYSCNKCHGDDGRGGSVGNVEVGKDAWGYEAAAADLTSGMFRGGGRPIDLYRRVLVGINGAPMPSRRVEFESDPDGIWHIVHFLKDVGEKRRRETVEATLTGLGRLKPKVESAEKDEAAATAETEDAAAAEADRAAADDGEEPAADDAEAAGEETPAAEETTES
ncbi:MAG: c-type cytochrome [Pirellulales bacterium]|nr:c-type cytochrome [Pirellulales bacterium]